MTDMISFRPPTPEPLLIVISGPSGVGKDSILQRMKERNQSFHFVVTATTRPPRPTEVNGVDYHFVSHGEFARMMEDDELLEFAHVYNDYKGIPKQQVREALASQNDVIMRLDVQGAASIRKLSDEAVLIFVTTRDEPELVNRLWKRKTESDEQLNLRIAMARQELRRVQEFDYIVVNEENQLDETVDTILAIIEAEHCKIHQGKVSL